MNARLLPVAMLVLVACAREKRELREAPDDAGTKLAPAPIVAGGLTRTAPDSARIGPVQLTRSQAYTVSEGKRLYSQWNCASCHAHGGGAWGPPLMDAEWLYGGSDAEILASIIQGRPNGMPAFGARISRAQGKQLTAFVVSLSGRVRADVRSGRPEHMQVRRQDQALEKQPVRRGTP
jgi:cytochrome c oxidase cbb3-type subunit III